MSSRERRDSASGKISNTGEDYDIYNIDIAPSGLRITMKMCSGAIIRVVT